MFKFEMKSHKAGQGFVDLDFHCWNETLHEQLGTVSKDGWTPTSCFRADKTPCTSTCSAGRRKEVRLSDSMLSVSVGPPSCFIICFMVELFLYDVFVAITSTLSLSSLPSALRDSLRPAVTTLSFAGNHLAFNECSSLCNYLLLHIMIFWTLHGNVIRSGVRCLRP